MTLAPKKQIPAIAKCVYYKPVLLCHMTVKSFVTILVIVILSYLLFALFTVLFITICVSVIFCGISYLIILCDNDLSVVTI